MKDRINRIFRCLMPHRSWDFTCSNANQIGFVVICILFGGFNFLNAQCPPTAANLIFTPNKPVYCPGDNITIQFVAGGPINMMNWYFDGIGDTYTTAIDVFQIDRIAQSGQIHINGDFFDPISGGPCIFSLIVVVNMSPFMSADAGPDRLITGNPAFANIGGTVLFSGGTAPHTLGWSPATWYVSPSTPLDGNPNVNPPSGTVYQLTVTDNEGCTASDNVTVYNAASVINNKNYAILKKNLDAGYHNTITVSANKFLYFMFEEEYFVPTGTNLSYSILANGGSLVSPPAVVPVIIGDNRYALNVNSLTTGFYTLLARNAKNEEVKTRFKVN